MELHSNSKHRSDVVLSPFLILEEKSSVRLPGVSAAPPLVPIPCNLNTYKLSHHANLPVAKLAR